MKPVVLSVTLGLALVSCAKKKVHTPTCDEMGKAVVEHFMSNVKDSDAADAKRIAMRMAAMTSQRLVQHCKSDAWSPEMIRCAERGDLATCDGLLTTDQKQTLSADVERR